MATITVSMKGRHIKRFKASPSCSKSPVKKKNRSDLIGSSLVSTKSQVHSHVETNYTNPFAYIEPIRDFDESYERHGMNSEPCQMYFRSYTELLNKEEDEKTAQTLRMCKAIWILPEAYNY